MADKATGLRSLLLTPAQARRARIAAEVEGQRTVTALRRKCAALERDNIRLCKAGETMKRRLRRAVGVVSSILEGD